MSGAQMEFLKIVREVSQHSVAYRREILAEDEREYHQNSVGIFKFLNI